jgi:hypothetical protein
MSFSEDLLWGEAICRKKMANKILGVWFGYCGKKLVIRIWVFGSAYSEIVDYVWENGKNANMLINRPNWKLAHALSITTFSFTRTKIFQRYTHITSYTYSNKLGTRKCLTSVVYNYLYSTLQPQSEQINDSRFTFIKPDQQQ